jgi:hypothetical protein
MPVIKFFEKSLINHNLVNSYLIIGELNDHKINQLLDLLLGCPIEDNLYQARRAESLIIQQDEKRDILKSQADKILAFAKLKPVLSQRRVIVIKNAHSLNKEAANHLLKIIEEPPCYLIFLLITKQPTYLLETILSRCVTLKVAAFNQTLNKEKQLMYKKILKNDLNDRFLLAEKLSKEKRHKIINFLNDWIIFLQSDILKYTALITDIQRTKTILEKTYANPRLALERLFVKMD